MFCSHVPENQLRELEVQTAVFFGVLSLQNQSILRLAKIAWRAARVVRDTNVSSPSFQFHLLICNCVSGLVATS